MQNKPDRLSIILYYDNIAVVWSITGLQNVGDPGTTGSLTQLGRIGLKDKFWYQLFCLEIAFSTLYLRL